MNEYVYPVLAVFFYGFIILLFLSLFFPSANIFFHIGIQKKYKRINYEAEYFRNILSYSPSEIYYIYNKNFGVKNKFGIFKMYKFRKLFLINLLKMDLLGYINIDFTDKNNFKITKKDVIILDEEYKFINDYIFGCITSNNEISLYEIYDYINEHYKETVFKNWDEFIQKKIRRRGFYDGNFITFYGDKIKSYYKITIPIIAIINLFVIVIAFNFGIALIFVFALFLICGYYETKNIKVISDVGIYEYRKMIALKKFLKDFSIIDERGPEYSQILEDYIVYASIFNMLKNKIYSGNVKAGLKYFIYDYKNDRI